MPNTFFIADWHYGHNNIISHDDRPFRSVEEMNESLIIAAADFKCCIDKNVGNVVVCGAYTAHEGVKLIKTVDAVNVGVYKTYAVAYIKGQLLLLFDADDIAGTGGCSLIYPVNKLLGFSCTFAADYK